MFKKMFVAAACSMVALSAIAVDAGKVEKSIELKDGSIVYVFKDGKMGMENKKGQVVRMKPGQVMDGKDGQRYIMIGDDVARLDSLLKDANRKQ